MRIAELLESNGFGQGWWHNVKTGVTREINSSELGPHGDHDGWIAIGDHATDLGVDPVKAKAFQAAVYGFVDDTGEFSEYADRSGYVYSASEHDNDEFVEKFVSKYGMDPDEAAHDVSFPELIRFRLWPKGDITVTSDGSGPKYLRATRVLVNKILSSNPQVGDDNSVYVELGGDYYNTTVGSARKGQFVQIKESKSASYFLRCTSDPTSDLQRGFSCNVNAWTTAENRAKQMAAIHSVTGKPLYDQKSKLWCWDPELGLSSFGFRTKEEFQLALKRAREYSLDDSEIAVFRSSDYDNGVGLDGEDVFRDGIFVCWLKDFSDFSGLTEAVDREKTLSTYRDRLEARKPREASPEEVLDKLLSVLSQHQQKFPLVKWVLDRYLSGEIKRAEDFGRAAGALEVVSSRGTGVDISKMSFRDLERLALEIKKTPSRKEKREQEKLDLSGQIKTVYSGPEGKVLVPKTEAASKYLGRGTTWCTAARNGNEFESYNSEGPLYVIMSNDGRKFQFHAESAQLVDEEDDDLLYSDGGPPRANGDMNDSYVNFTRFKELYPWVFGKVIKRPSLNKMIQIIQNGYPNVIAFWSDTPEKVQLAAIKQDPESVMFISEPPEKVQLAAVKASPDNIAFINNPTEFVQVLSIEEDPKAVEWLRLVKNPSKRAIEIAREAKRQGAIHSDLSWYKDV